MRTIDYPWQELIAAAGSGRRRRRLGAAPARPPRGPGTLALALYVAFLAVYYTLQSGAWWLDDRYLAPAVLLSVPLLAAAAEGRRKGRAPRGAARSPPRC